MAAYGFLFDENVDPILRYALESHGAAIGCRSVGDAGAPDRGSPDPSILDWCERNGFALVTNNRATMSVHLADQLQRGGHVPAIFMLSPLQLIGELAEAGEFLDRITYLPI
jgi:hypothetical protein